jgi:uncharacterized protein
MTLRDVLINREEGRPRAGVRLVLHLILLLVLVLVFDFAAVALLTIVGGSLEGTPGMLIQSVTLLLAITFSVWLARRSIDRRSLAGLGLPRRRAGRDLLFGFAVSGAMMALIYGVELALGWLRFEGYGPGAGPAAGWPLEIAGWLVVFLMVGWYEELLNRGYWLVNLSEGLNRIAAALLTSIAFAALHVSNPSASWASAAGLFISGLWFAYAAFASRGLWLPVGAHIGWNIFEGVVFGFPVSGLTTATLIRQASSGPALWTGGPFGPEAGLVVLPALALGALAVWKYSRLSKRGEDENNP